MRLLGVLALVGTIVVTACGEEDVVPVRPAPSKVATLQDLLAPWQATPFALDPAWRNTIEAACRRDLQEPRGAGGIVDARGGGVATVRFTGRVRAKCDALRVTPEGKVEGAGGGGGGGSDVAPPERPVHIGSFIEEGFVAGAQLTITGWSVTGQVSADVARVEVVTALYPPITATVENGWFSAWWPAPPGDRRPTQSVMAPYRIRAFDAEGALLAER
jgi:hypothetical protein